MKQVNDTKFHLIPCDFIHYREIYIYLFFLYPHGLIYFITRRLYLLIPSPTSSSPQPPPLWQPPACHRDLHLNPTLLSLTQFYLMLLQTTWLPEIRLAPCVIQAINTWVYSMW